VSKAIIHGKGFNVLPTKLSEIKQKLTAKGFTARSTDEDALLDELTKLDAMLDEPIVKKSSVFNDSRMTTGPSNRCSCCGK
jgi:hypothetical protein